MEEPGTRAGLLCDQAVGIVGPAMQTPSHDTLRRLAAAEAMVANVPDPIVLVGRNGLVGDANAAAHAMLPTLRLGYPLSYALRAPGILDAVAAAAPG
ncbi:MAG TPA: hypothetical protein VGD16_12915, partial [Enterovirga sp.]